MLSQDIIKIHPNTPALSSTCCIVIVLGPCYVLWDQNKAQVILVSFFGAMVTVMERVQLGVQKIRLKLESKQTLVSLPVILRLRMYYQAF